MEQPHDRSSGAWRRARERLARPARFLPLRHSAARLGAAPEALETHECDGLLVLQDTAITGDEPTVAGGPMSDARESIAFLDNSAQRTQEVHS